MFPKAVIDSGPLFDALVLNYDLRRAGDGQPPRFASQYGSILDGVLQKVAAQRQFLALLKSIREKLTTSHVIAEVFGLEKSRLKLRGTDLDAFWRTSIDLLVQWRIEETLIRLLDLASHDSLRICLPEIGVTDTGLIELAARHGCVLITRDARALAREARIRQVDCRLVSQLVPLV
jgi:rRNA-processing protein FCF1